MHTPSAAMTFSLWPFLLSLPPDPPLTGTCFPDSIKWHPSTHVYNINWQYTQVCVGNRNVLHDISAPLFLERRIKTHHSIYIWIAGALGGVPITSTTFVEKQLQSGPRDLSWSCTRFSWLTRFWLPSPISTSWCILFSACSFSSLAWLFNAYPSTWSPRVSPLWVPREPVLTLLPVFIPCNCLYNHSLVCTNAAG